MSKGRHRKHTPGGTGRGVSTAAIATTGAFALVPMVLSTATAAADTPAPVRSESLPSASPAAKHAAPSVPAPRHALREETTPRHAAPAAEDSYTVQPGDTMYKIAAGKGVTWKALWEANKSTVTQPNVLHPGEQLKLPTASSIATPKPSTDPAKTAAPTGTWAKLASKAAAATPGAVKPAVKKAATPTKVATAAKADAVKTTGPTQQKKIWLTGYSYQDNTPAGSSIVSTPVLHKEAGGTGTYADPITVAVPGKGNGIWKSGSRFYLPTVKRYVIAEDTGASPAPSGQDGHLDMWIGGQGGTKSATDACMDKITATGVTAQYNPPSNLPVIKGPIYSAGKCNI
ncbi:LysM peptidoglycan-binding domain-containing protein [Pseudonocardia spinosispora]|uniref:LysM peptidoglycan-binding domain-containing protein n=1 Tax=Pseudonocardia spinosispora TaxID=103441 RepID=UPI00041CA6E4|nr:LysM peptidoglycan-binding domain-containing protein [Pseudonocardia spinosispora]